MQNTISNYRSETMNNEISKFPIVASVDNHCSNNYLFCVDTQTGEIVADCNLPGNLESVTQHLRKIRVPKKKTMILYEAGNAGFFPYRFFATAGYACKIIAPSSLPKKKKKNKTDRIDAMNNFKYHCASLLRYVVAPSIHDEDNRELTRYRIDIAQQISKQKQKIISLLKRFGKNFTETKSNWTRKHFAWLRRTELPSSTRFILDVMLDTVETLSTHLERIEEEIKQVVTNNEYYRKVTMILETLPGVGDLYSKILAFEISNYNRFHHGKALMKYSGLIPGKHSSGTSDPALRITKEGNRFIRLAFVGIAKSYRDRRLLKSPFKLKSLPEPLAGFIEKMQDRLHSRYRYLRSQGKPAGVAKCAIARELCGFILELVTGVLPEIEFDYNHKMVA